MRQDRGAPAGLSRPGARLDDVRLALVLLLTAFFGCTVRLEDPAGRACDDAHPCRAGRVCFEGQCVLPGTHADSGEHAPDAGAPPLDDAGLESDGGTDSGMDAGNDRDGGHDGGDDPDAGPSDAGGDAGADAGPDGPDGGSDAGSDPCAGAPVGQVCTVGKGACTREGQLTCSNGVTACSATAGSPQPETCDGVDNDCDEQVDEGLTPPACSLTSGVCAGATQNRTCQGAAGWTACNYGPDFQSTEAACDRRDNDCDGVVDDVSGCLYTLAGVGAPAFQDGSAAQARFSGPAFLTSDANGVIYVADMGNHAIRRVGTDGTVVTIAGDGTCGFQDGPVATARFCLPRNVQVANDGTLYVSDSGNFRIRRIANGVVDTLAGNGSDGNVNGAALSASFSRMGGINLRPNGDLLIADMYNGHIRRYVAATQTVQHEAGAGYGTAEGTRSTVQLMGPVDVAEDSQGNLYVSEQWGSRLRKIPPSGQSVTIAGAVGQWDYQEGVGGASRLTSAGQLLLDEAAGLLYFADGWSYRIRAVPLNLTASTFTVAGGAGWGYRNGALADASFLYVAGFTRAQGDWFISDENHVIRRATPGTTTTTVSDFTGGVVTDVATDGSTTLARLRQPRSVVRAPNGSLYWTDVDRHMVRRLRPDGVVETVIGSATSYAWGYVNGSFANARVHWPQDLALGPDGRIYLSDGANHALRVLDLQSAGISTFAGPTTSGGEGHTDGSLTQARFRDPRALVFGRDSTGAQALYVNDRANHVIRKVLFPNGPVSTIAGVPGVPGRVDGPIGTGTLNDVGGIAADDSGNLWVADSGAIRHIAPNGTVTTLYATLPIHPAALILEGADRLIVVGGSSVLRLSRDPSSPQIQTVFEARQGWRDGTASTAGAYGFNSVLDSPTAWYLTDGVGGRLRRLWK